MEGAVLWDSISQLDFYLTEDSLFTGFVLQDEPNAGEGGEGYANLYLSEDSTWIVTEDSTLTGLYASGAITDADGKTVTIKDSDGTLYVEGESSLTITVDEYAEEADLTNAGKMTDWADYEAEKPEEWQDAEEE